MKNFINSEEVLKNLSTLKIIDCRFNMKDPESSKIDYEKSHIKSAYYMDLEKDLSSNEGEHGGRHPLPDLNEFISKLESFGIDNQSSIVVYDEDITIAPRLWWMIKYIGLENVKILNGGFLDWTKKEFPVDNLIHNINDENKGQIRINIKHDMISDINDIKKAIQDDNFQIIDSRSPERYRGITEPIDKIAGRIPTSINIFYENAYKNAQIKMKDELISLFEGINNLNEPIFYCGSGITAAINIVAADEINIKSKLYVGSFSDYISYQDNPIEKDI